jgi:hypothetical protein
MGVSAPRRVSEREELLGIDGRMLHRREGEHPDPGEPDGLPELLEQLLGPLVVLGPSSPNNLASTSGPLLTTVQCRSKSRR